MEKLFGDSKIGELAQELAGEINISDLGAKKRLEKQLCQAGMGAGPAGGRAAGGPGPQGPPKHGAPDIFILEFI